MKPLSPKTIFLVSLAILLVAGFIVVAVRSGSKNNSSSQEKQSAGAGEKTLADLTTPTPSQTDQAEPVFQPDQIASIDKSAQENLGGDYKVEGASFVKEPQEENGVKVQVGDPSAKEVLPELTLSRWDETKMTLKPKLDGLAAKDRKVSFEKDRIKFDTPKVAYNLENLPVSDERPEGGFEYDIVLKEKPATNVVSLDIDTENLDFFYQPALTPEEVAQGAERPENVVGSYAVYYKDGKSGDYTALGGKNYMAGKAFHIYRPKIEDATGKRVWGDLHIDEKAGVLTVTIPQDFLDKAVYPVRHAAGLEFGYNNTGSSQGYTGSANQADLFKAYGTPTQNGTITSVSMYLTKAGSSNEFDPAVYQDFTGTWPSQNASRVAFINSGGTAIPGSDYVFSWVQTNISAAIISGTQYWLGRLGAAGTVGYGYDTATNEQAPNNQTSWADPYSMTYDWQWGNRRASIYATYTPNIYIKNNVNFKTNVNFK